MIYKPRFLRHRALGAVVVGASIVGLTAAATQVTSLTPAASAAQACRPGPRVLARHAGVVFWSARLRVGAGVRVRVYVCARPSGRTYVVASGQPGLAPAVGGVKAAGHFVAFLLTTGSQRNVNLVVFDLARGRRELTENDGCRGSQGCTSLHSMSQSALARTGFIAEVWPVVPGFQTSTMVATADARHYYSIDVARAFSSLAVSGGVLSWTSDLGGASSVTLGPDVIPSGGPRALTPCQLVTAAEASAVSGNSSLSSSSSPGQCAFTTTGANFAPLTVGVQTGLSPAQATSAEQALLLAHWSGPVGYKEGYTGLQLRTVFRGGVERNQLDAFQNGAQLSLDMTSFPPVPEDGLPWLTDVAFDRLFGVPVHRST
jgi:hypothetical protein